LLSRVIMRRVPSQTVSKSTPGMPNFQTPREQSEALSIRTEEIFAMVSSTIPLAALCIYLNTESDLLIQAVPETPA
jgi:hypothetical protein